MSLFNSLSIYNEKISRPKIRMHHYLLYYVTIIMSIYVSSLDNLTVYLIDNEAYGGLIKENLVTMEKIRVLFWTLFILPMVYSIYYKLITSYYQKKRRKDENNNPVEYKKEATLTINNVSYYNHYLRFENEHGKKCNINLSKVFTSNKERDINTLKGTYSIKVFYYPTKNNIDLINNSTLNGLDITNKVISLEIL